MSPDKILYTAHATATAGRNGLTRTDDAMVVHLLATPVAMGGNGKGSNPEQLFAAGYAACFGSAVEFVARAAKTAIGEVRVSAEVGIGPTAAGFGLAVALRVHIAGVDAATAETLVARAHEVCPYSNATRGNIPVDVQVEG
jgi:lipoyl-dependent peroxiredoxin